MTEQLYTVEHPNKLSSWNDIAITELKKWYLDEEYQKDILLRVMVGENMGPFTKFLYYFAGKCKCSWGVMIDFNERSQKIFLTEHYYKWMHKLRDELNLQDETTLPSQQAT